MFSSRKDIPSFPAFYFPKQTKILKNEESSLKRKCWVIFSFIVTFTGHGLFCLTRARYAKSTINLPRDQEILPKDFSRVRGMGTAVYAF